MTTAVTSPAPNEICVLFGEVCKILLAFQDSCGDAVNLTGALVEFSVWQSMADVCERPLLYCSTAPGGGIWAVCPQEGQFILCLVQDHYRHLCTGGFCWKIRVTLPHDLLTDTGTASVAEGSPVISLTGADIDEITENTVAYLGTHNIDNAGPFLVSPEVIVAPPYELSECCACGPATPEDTPVPTGPTGDLIAQNASFVPEVGMPFALYTADYYNPPELHGPFKIKACEP